MTEKTALFIAKHNRLVCDEKKVWLHLNGVSVHLLELCVVYDAAYQPS